MKKLLLFLVIIPVMLSSCVQRYDKESFFDYQQGAFSLEGTLDDGITEYGIILNLGKKENGKRNYMSLEYTKPDELAGYIFLYSDGKLTATVGDVSVDVPIETLEGIFSVSEMFDLTKDTITDIYPDSEGNSVAEGSGYTVKTDKKGVPVEISLNGEALKINKFNSIGG